MQCSLLDNPRSSYSHWAAHFSVSVGGSGNETKTFYIEAFRDDTLGGKKKIQMPWKGVGGALLVPPPAILFLPLFPNAPHHKGNPHANAKVRPVDRPPKPLLRRTARKDIIEIRNHHPNRPRAPNFFPLVAIARSAEDDAAGERECEEGGGDKVGLVGGEGCGARGDVELGEDLVGRVRSEVGTRNVEQGFEREEEELEEERRWSVCADQVATDKAIDIGENASQRVVVGRGSIHVCRHSSESKGCYSVHR